MHSFCQIEKVRDYKDKVATNKEMIKCNLCGQEFEEDDELLSQRKARHAEHHDGTKYRQGANIIRGTVQWLHE